MNSTMRWATRLMPVASATDEPPYFWTTIPTVVQSRRRGQPRPAYAVAVDRPVTRSVLEHLLGRRDVLRLAGEVLVEPVVGEH